MTKPLDTRAWQCSVQTAAQGYRSIMERADFRAGYSDGFYGAHAGFGIEKRTPAYDRGFSIGRVDRPASDRATTAEDVATAKRFSAQLKSQ